jgi:hypothetical protein
MFGRIVMRIPHLRLAAVTLAAGIGLSGCTTYDPYGYSGVSVGLGYGNGYYDPYYGGGYGYGSPYGGYGYGSPYGGYGYGSPYGGYGYGSPYGYNSSYWGWNNGYYYPGTGYYVYDSARRPHTWSDTQRRYWTERRKGAGTSNHGAYRDNWTGFTRDRQSGVQTGSIRTTRVERSNSEPSVFNRGQTTREDRRTQVRSSTSDGNNRGSGRNRRGTQTDQD